MVSALVVDELNDNLLSPNPLVDSHSTVTLDSSGGTITNPNNDEYIPIYRTNNSWRVFLSDVEDYDDNPSIETPLAKRRKQRESPPRAPPTQHSTSAELPLRYQALGNKVDERAEEVGDPYKPKTVTFTVGDELLYDNAHECTLIRIVPPDHFTSEPQDPLEMSYIILIDGAERTTFGNRLSHRKRTNRMSSSSGTSDIVPIASHSERTERIRPPRTHGFHNVVARFALLHERAGHPNLKYMQRAVTGDHPAWRNCGLSASQMYRARLSMPSLRTGQAEQAIHPNQ